MRQLTIAAVFMAACAGRAPAPQTASPQQAGIAWPMALDHASTPETHLEAALLVLDASGMQDTMTKLIDVSLEMQLRQQPQLRQYQAVLREFLLKHLSYASIRDELARAYVERFDELQLRQIAAFYATPTGKAAVDKLAELSALGGDIGRRRVETHQAELVEMMQAADADQQRAIESQP